MSFTAGLRLNGLDATMQHDGLVNRTFFPWRSLDGHPRRHGRPTSAEQPVPTRPERPDELDHASVPQRRHVAARRLLRHASAAPEVIRSDYLTRSKRFEIPTLTQVERVLAWRCDRSSIRIIYCVICSLIFAVIEPTLGRPVVLFGARGVRVGPPDPLSFGRAHRLDHRTVLRQQPCGDDGVAAISSASRQPRSARKPELAGRNVASRIGLITSFAAFWTMRSVAAGMLGGRVRPSPFGVSTCRTGCGR
jgi:hypothetical protein